MFEKIRWWLWEVEIGIHNLFYWLPVIWRDGQCDWTYLTTIMEHKFRRMSNFYGKQEPYVSSKKDAKDMLICAELLKRIAEDDIVNCESFAQHDMRMKGWEEMFGKIFNKKLRGWWT